METGKNLVPTSPAFPPRTHLRGSPSSVSVLHEQAASTLASRTRQLLPSFLVQEQKDDYRSLTHVGKAESTSQGTLNGTQMELEVSVPKENMVDGSDEYLKEFGDQLLKWPCLWNLLPSLQPGEDASLPLVMQYPTMSKKHVMDVHPQDLVNLAKKALSASIQAADMVQESKLCGINTDVFNSPSLGPPSLADSGPEIKRMVRSTRLGNRQSKKRKVAKLQVMVPETSSFRQAVQPRKVNEKSDQNDPVRMFLSGPEAKQLLTYNEESELIVQIQGLIKLEEVKSRLQSQFEREPTLVEWAEALGMSYRVLQSQVNSGNNSRARLINANLRMVVHIAKQYQGRGLSLQDLLQEGSMGLMKSVERFKPQAGCRFATYAYWWIRQSIRKAIFQNSRTIRLPENVYGLLGKVLEAKKSHIQEGNHNPTDEQVSKRAGITVEKLRKVLLYARTPLSMQQSIWSDQDTTFQEVTADREVEIPDVTVAKQLMRKHVRSLLSVLSPKERQIIRQRFGIADGKEKSLTEIGVMLGLSKERIRQLESRSLYKLKQCLASHGLRAYVDLLI